MRLSSLVFVPCLALVAGQAGAKTTHVDRDLSRGFDVGTGDRLVLRHGDGDVEISPWEQSRVQVDVAYHATFDDVGLSMARERDFEVDFEQSDHTIRVTGREIGDSGIHLGVSSQQVGQYLYRVQAPSWLLLELEGEDGDVDIEGWRADVSIHLEDGDASLRNSSCRLHFEAEDGDLEITDSEVEGLLSTEDGNVTVRGGAGTFDVAVDDGDVTLDQVAATNLRIRAQDGDVVLSLLPVEALALDLRLDDGDAVVALAPGLSAGFTVTTDDGDVRVALSDVGAVTRSGHRTVGTIGDGSGRIEIRTADGDVTLRGNP